MWVAPAIAFVLYALASMQWSVGDSLLPTLHLASLVGAFLVGFLYREVERLWLGYFVLTTVSFIFLGYLPYSIWGNPNMFGCALALGVAAALAYEQFWFAVVGTAGIVYSGSRGSFLAICIAWAIYTWRQDRFLLIPLSGLFFVLAALIIINRGEADASLLARLGIWQDTLNNLTMWGSGWGSFYDAYATWPLHTNMAFPLTRPAHVYNDFLQLIFELGIGAIFAWIALALLFERASPADRLILWTFLTLSLTYFPLSVPVVGQLLFLTLGHAGANTWQTGNSSSRIISKSLASLGAMRK